MDGPPWVAPMSECLGGRGTDFLECSGLSSQGCLSRAQLQEVDAACLQSKAQVYLSPGLIKTVFPDGIRVGTCATRSRRLRIISSGFLSCAVTRDCVGTLGPLCAILWELDMGMHAESGHCAVLL